MTRPAPAERGATTPRYLLDRSLATLREAAPRWTALDLSERIAHLETVSARFDEIAADLVADSVRAKGIGSESVGEEWVVGPVSVLRTVRFLRDTLEGIRRRGEVPLPDRAVRERADGQVAVDVLPGDLWDRLLYPKWTAEVRMDPSIPRSRARREMGGIHTKPELAVPAVSVILGAGNVSSIAPLDVVHKLFVDGEVALLKFNPINDYIGPYVEHAFADLIAAGFVRTSYGGADTGDYLVTHPEVDSIHVTGSEETHDAIVFGTGEEGRRRKERNEPRLGKAITSELGNVSPVIVVAGDWSRRAIELQAEHVATQLLHNAGYNCNAAKVIVLPESWPQRDEFLERVGEKLASRPDRPAYYPGSLERYERVVGAGGEVRTFGSSDSDLPPTMIEIDAERDHPAFDTEAFCRMMAVVDLPGDDPEAFLDAAVGFCNERLRGTLNATVLVDPATAREHERAVESAIDRLRYGSVGVNLWAASCFPLGVTPWGAFPGHTLDDIGSGIGFVHNARLVDHPQKTVVRAPFIPFPKPPWSVFHRRSASVMRRVSAFEADPSPWRLPGIVLRAMAS